MIAAVYGLQVLVFVLRWKWDMIVRERPMSSDTFVKETVTPMSSGGPCQKL
jgi:hypothetical protein